MKSLCKHLGLEINTKGNIRCKWCSDSNYSTKIYPDCLHCLWCEKISTSTDLTEKVTQKSMSELQQYLINKKNLQTTTHKDVNEILIQKARENVRKRIQELAAEINFLLLVEKEGA